MESRNVVSERRGRRWRFSYSLRTLTTAFVLIALLLGAIGSWVHRANRQRQLLRHFTSKEPAPGPFHFRPTILYDYQVGGGEFDFTVFAEVDVRAKSPYPVWFVHKFGVDAVHSPVLIGVPAATRLDLDRICDLHCVQHVCLFEQNELADEDIAHLIRRNHRNLKSLVICGDRITDASVGHVTRAKGITKLSLDGRITDAGVRKLLSMKQLTHLSLTSPYLSDEVLSTIRELPVLQWLSMKSDALSSSAQKQFGAALSADTSWVASGAPDAYKLDFATQRRELRSIDPWRELTEFEKDTLDEAVKAILDKQDVDGAMWACQVIEQMGLYHCRGLETVVSVARDETYNVSVRGSCARICLQVRHPLVVDYALNAINTVGDRIAVLNNDAVVDSYLRPLIEADTLDDYGRVVVDGWVPPPSDNARYADNATYNDEWLRWWRQHRQDWPPTANIKVER